MSRKGCVSSYVGEVSVIYPQDREIRNGDAPAYQAELKDLIAQAKHRKVLLNYENVDYLGSMPFGDLVRFCLQCRKDEVIVKFCGFKKELKNDAHIFGLPRLAEFFDSEAEALKSFEERNGWFGG